MRKYIRIWLSLMLLYGLASCQNGRDMKINHDPTQKMPLQETENIRFEESWVRWDLAESLRLYDYLVKETEEINNIPCKGIITLYTLGDLFGFVFGQDYELNGTMIPAGSRYETTLDGVQKRKNM